MNRPECSTTSEVIRAEGKVLLARILNVPSVSQFSYRCLFEWRSQRNRRHYVSNAEPDPAHFPSMGSVLPLTVADILDRSRTVHPPHLYLLQFSHFSGGWFPNYGCFRMGLEWIWSQIVLCFFLRESGGPGIFHISMPLILLFDSQQMLTLAENEEMNGRSSFRLKVQASPDKNLGIH